MTWAEIGKELGISRWRVQQIADRAMAKLRKACVKHGISADDVIGHEGSMLARAELWSEK